MTTETALTPEAQAAGLPDKARAQQILNEADLAVGTTFLRTCKTVSKALDEKYDAEIERLFRAHKAKVLEKKTAAAPVLLAEQITKLAIGSYAQSLAVERERLRRENEELARQAREAEEAEVAAALERRMNAEREVRDELVDRAAVLEAEGRHQEAQELLQRADTAEADSRVTEAELVDSAIATVAPAPVVSSGIPAAPKMEGVSLRDSWEWELLDASKLNPAFVIIDRKAIDAQVRTMKERAAAVVGEGAIRVFKGAPTVSARGF